MQYGATKTALAPKRKKYAKHLFYKELIMTLKAIPTQNFFDFGAYTPLKKLKKVKNMQKSCTLDGHAFYKINDIF